MRRFRDLPVFRVSGRVQLAPGCVRSATGRPVHRLRRCAPPPLDRVSTVSTTCVHRQWTAVLPPTLPGVHQDQDAGERGSTLPFVLVCWTVAALMAFGAIAAS